MAQQLDTATPNATGLDAEKVLADLTKAWQGTDKSQPGSVVRAATLNLIIYSPDPEAADDLEPILDGLIERHPCRALHVVHAPTEKQLRAATRVHMRSVGETRQLSCEEVTILGDASQLADMEGVIAPLLSADLPVYLWWRGQPPFEGELFESLAEVANHLLIDTASFDKPSQSVPWLARFVLERRDEIAWCDMNWSRLTPWRLLVAQFFDGPSRLPYLSKVRGVDIVYADSGTPPTLAFLLAGWLASRLDWKPGTASGQTVKLQSEQGDIEVRLQAGKAATSSMKGLVSIKLSTDDAWFLVEMLDGGKYARTVMQLAQSQPVERVVPMDAQTEVFLLGRELGLPGRDVIYEQALTACLGFQSLG
jgi:glucose-6-phosphate dehydrogenase assembly protein OpcA